jgi:hypothetical protein
MKLDQIYITDIGEATLHVKSAIDHSIDTRVLSLEPVGMPQLLSLKLSKNHTSKEYVDAIQSVIENGRLAGANAFVRSCEYEVSPTLALLAIQYYRITKTSSKSARAKASR